MVGVGMMLFTEQKYDGVVHGATFTEPPPVIA